VKAFCRTLSQPLALLALCVGFSANTHAATCSVASLATYNALGAPGCTVDGVQFGSFTPLTGSYTSIDPNAITLNPILNGFAITLNQTANAGEQFQALFSFLITGSPFTGGTVALLGSTINADGANTGTATLTPGGLAIAFDIGVASSLAESFVLEPSASQEVLLDFVIDGGTAGSASLSQGSITFTPEPSAFLLLSSGGALLGLLRLRHRSQFQPNFNQSRGKQ
jgi:hypothetical protein